MDPLNPEEIILDGLTFESFVSEKEIGHAVHRIADRLMKDFSDETPVFIGVLNGSFMFMSDLMKKYKGSCKLDFIKMKSYEGTCSSGDVKEIIGFEDQGENPIIIVEDIVDTGNTIEAMVVQLAQKGITNFKIASLFLKPEVYNKPYAIDYVGLEIPDKFIVGYGLDYNGLGRNLPEIYQLKKNQK